MRRGEALTRRLSWRQRQVEQETVTRPQQTQHTLEFSAGEETRKEKYKQAHGRGQKKTGVGVRGGTKTRGMRSKIAEEWMQDWSSHVSTARTSRLIRLCGRHGTGAEVEESYLSYAQLQVNLDELETT